MFYQLRRSALLELIPLSDVSISIGTVASQVFLSDQQIILMKINHKKKYWACFGLFLKLRLLICLARVGNCVGNSSTSLCK